MPAGHGAQLPSPGAAPAPVEVGVVMVTQGTIGLLTELPGRTEASRVAQVRARAAGILQRQLFREGSDVKAEQVLFQIDAAPYRATLASVQASLARAEANLMQAQAQAFVAAGGVQQPDWLAQARALHLAAVQRRLSPGGSADVLASACWLVALEADRDGELPGAPALDARALSAPLISKG